MNYVDYKEFINELLKEGQYLKKVKNDCNKQESFNTLINKKTAYNFLEMLKEFDNGYSGSFTDSFGNIITFDNDKQDIVIKKDDKEIPKSYKIYNSCFTKVVKKKIANSDIILYVLLGKKLLFTVDVFNCTINGKLSYDTKNNVPYFYISENPNKIDTSIILLKALFDGEWTQEI